jgi:hypothetical protein
MVSIKTFFFSLFFFFSIKIKQEQKKHLKILFIHHILIPNMYHHVLVEMK